MVLHQHSHDLIVNQLKALIARDALGYTAYFTIVNTMDSNVKRAVNELLEGGAAFPINNPASDLQPSVGNQQTQEQ